MFGFAKLFTVGALAISASAAPILDAVLGADVDVLGLAKVDAGANVIARDIADVEAGAKAIYDTKATTQGVSLEVGAKA